MKPVGKNKQPIKIDATIANPNALELKNVYFLVAWTKSPDSEFAVKNRNNNIPGRIITVLEYLNLLSSVSIIMLFLWAFVFI